MSHAGGHTLADGGEEGWPLGVQLFGRERLMCVQQFLIKGLLKPETELCTIEVGPPSPPPPPPTYFLCLQNWLAS